jgi:hypothetical protein
MADLSLEDPDFVERQNELIAEHDAPDDFVGDVILEVRPALRDEDHFAPLQRLTAVQAFGANDSPTQDGGIGVVGVGAQNHSGIRVKGIGKTGIRGESAKLSDAHGVIGVVFGSPAITPFLPSSGFSDRDLAWMPQAFGARGSLAPAFREAATSAYKV